MLDPKPNPNNNSNRHIMQKLAMWESYRLNKFPGNMYENCIQA